MRYPPALYSGSASIGSCGPFVARSFSSSRSRDSALSAPTPVPEADFDGAGLKSAVGGLPQSVTVALVEAVVDGAATAVPEGSTTAGGIDGGDGLPGSNSVLMTNPDVCPRRRSGLKQTLDNTGQLVCRTAQIPAKRVFGHRRRQWPNEKKGQTMTACPYVSLVGRAGFEPATNGLKDENPRLLPVLTQGFQTHANVTGCHA